MRISCHVDGRSGLVVLPHTLHPSLELLVVRNNNITQVDSAFFHFATELVAADLSCNGFQRVQENSWELNSRLERLSLAENEIKELPDLRGLESLTSLNLSHNQLQTLPGDVVTTGLEELDLAGNQVRALPALPGSLKLLNLRGNQISSVWSVLAQSDLPLLASLDLSENPLLSLPPLPPLPGLLSLRLANTGLSSLPSSALLEVGALRHLDLSQNRLTVVGGNHLAGLHHLLSLHLSHNPSLASIQPGGLSNLSSLEQLNIAGANLTTLSLPASVRSVRAENNPWLCDCNIAELHQLLTSSAQSSLPPVLCRRPAEYEGLPVTSVNLQLCLEEGLTGQQQQGPRQEEAEEAEETDNYRYFYSVLIVGSISVMLLILIVSRRRLVRALTKSR